MNFIAERFVKSWLGAKEKLNFNLKTKQKYGLLIKAVKISAKVSQHET